MSEETAHPDRPDEYDRTSADHDHPLEDPSPAAVCGIADALRAGDDVRVGQRARTLTVRRRDEDLGITATGHQPADYPYRVVWLAGNGTEYRLRYSYRGETYPLLHTASELEVVTRGGHERIEATKSSGEAVLALSPAAASTIVKLSDWVLSRLLVEDGS